MLSQYFTDNVIVSDFPIFFINQIQDDKNLVNHLQTLLRKSQFPMYE